MTHSIADLECFPDPEDRAAKPRRRPKRLRARRPPPLNYTQILSWADAHFQQKGKFPNLNSGAIPGTDETWYNIDAALRDGKRSLRPGSSLARLLAEHRGVRNKKALPNLPYEAILNWADAELRRTGKYPKRISGPVADAPGETWYGINSALHKGWRGLPGGSSLTRLLAEYRGVANDKALPRLTIKQILAWMDAHRRRKGKWPNERSGAIHEAPAETWLGVDMALRKGLRGLRGGSSLARLLAKYRNVRNIRNLSHLSRRQIRTWARAHYRRHGVWPDKSSGVIPGSNGQTWLGVDTALNRGRRGLKGRSSLRQFTAGVARPRGR